ncbi:MAG TPA: phosphatase PAP2 family protein [Thermoanaerobaculia bacterium]|nr:phosphatase PAP2 family protein [Thermoanaerobaculia bacterium]
MKPHPRSKLSVYLLLLTMLGGSAAGAQEPAAPKIPPTMETPSGPVPSFPHLVGTDLRYVLGAPLHWTGRQWEHFSLAVAGIGAAALLDQTVRDRELHDHSHFSDQVSRDFEQFGQTGAFGVMGVFYVAGLLGDDSRARSVGEDGLISTLIAGGIITPALKLATGRVRPRDTDKTFDFKPFSGSSSFPSGHSTEAFAVASVIATHYDQGWVKAVSYGSAALVGFARVHHKAHFLSDVTAGAIIGTVTGRTVVHRNDQERHKYALMPVVGPHGEPGVGVAFSF